METISDFVDKKSEEKYRRRSSVSSMNRFISYKKGLSAGIDIMKDWALFYEENKFRTYILNKLTIEDLLILYLKSKEN